MNEVKNHISCRPGTTDAMERLASENSMLLAQLRDCRELLNQTNHELAELATIKNSLKVERDEALARVERLQAVIADMENSSDS